MRFIWHSLKNESWSSKVALVTHCFFKLLFCNIRRGICVPFLLVKPVLHNQTHTWSETWISNFPEVTLLDLVYCSKVSCTKVSLEHFWYLVSITLTAPISICLFVPLLPFFQNKLFAFLQFVWRYVPIIYCTSLYWRNYLYNTMLNIAVTLV